MPHDRRNRELKPGDRVILEGVVTEVHPGSAVCNVQVQPVHHEAKARFFGDEGAAWRNQPGDWRGPVTLCAHWLEKEPVAALIEREPAAVPGSAREAGMGDVAS